MFFDSGKVVVNQPRFATHSTTNSPRFTTTLHHKILKTPCKIELHHANLKTGNSRLRTGDPKQRLPDRKGALKLRISGVRFKSCP